MTKRQGRQEPLEPRVLHFIQEHHLVPAQSHLLVAVSGGPDSVCLLHILVRLMDELGIRLHVAHLNHQLRGAEAEADAHYVSNLAHRLGIPATVEQRDVKGYQKHKRISLEEAAREVRYTFLAQVAKAIGASRVAVGHTLDDHIETILMHLVRGTGTRGLRGLQPRAEWQSSENSLTIIRPLLQVSREETAGYCQDNKLMPRIDASNLSLSPLRNRIRHQLLPLLKSYNPQVTEALLRTAGIAGDDLAFLDKEGSQLWAKIARRQENTIILDKKGLLELPSALKRYLLRMSLEKLLGNVMDIEMRHIEEIMSALTKSAGKRLSLPGGLTFCVEYDRYLIGKDPSALSPLPTLEGESQLKLPGRTILPGWHAEATIIEPSAVKGIGLTDNEFTACFDRDKTGDKLVVRSRQPGDRFQPLGMSQPKKLNEFMIDAKIPQAWRQRIPLVCSPQHIIWVVGWRIDDRAKVTDATRQVLCLEFKRAN
jgi:tRNA(Ile)-lysidine synthase